MREVMLTLLFLTMGPRFSFWGHSLTRRPDSDDPEASAPPMPTTGWKFHQPRAFPALGYSASGRAPRSDRSHAATADLWHCL
jgi:hypothetical protein